MSRVIVVTGTDTGVGKTVAAATLAATALARGTVAVVKPVQTGIPPDGAGDPADVDEVHRLTGCQVHELVRLADPLAPDTAARMAGVPIPTVREHAEHVRTLLADTIIIEGAGGLLVRLDTSGGTLLDLAEDLAAQVYVACRAGLGTLNHTELTVQALRGRGIEPAGLVIGAWTDAPGLAERCNREDLPAVTGVPLVGVLPAGVDHLTRDEFLSAAPSWLLPC